MDTNLKDLQAINYKGFTYDYDVEQMSDCTKLYHYAKCGDLRIHFDHSPYSFPSPFDFKMWIDLGCPERISTGCLRYEHLREILTEGWKTYLFDLKSRDSDWSRSEIRITASSESHARAKIANGWRSCDITSFREDTRVQDLLNSYQEPAHAAQR